MIAATGALAIGSTNAQSWRVEPSFSLQETATNNVNLEPAASRRADLVTELTPSLRVAEKGARTSLVGLISVPILFYARTGRENNTADLTADLLGNVDVIDKWLGIEGQVSAAQQYFNPFGAQPLGLENATANRYQSDTYRISPYVHGVTPGSNITYELRNNNVWANLSGAPVAVNNFRYTEFTGKASNTESVFGWRAEFDHNDIRFNDQASIRTTIARASPVYNVDPQLRLAARLGYEDNRFPLESFHGTIYGAGFEWRPNGHANVLANWEHRFFGAAYHFSIDHRMPLWVWSLRVSRDISTYPQQLASLPAGGDVSALLNGLFLATIPDPAQRQQTVDQFIRDHGLPGTLSSALNLYSEQILLQESQTVSAGFTGVRNTILLTVFNVHNEPVSGFDTSLSSLLAAINNNKQTGVSLVWSHKLSPSMVFDATVERFRTTANAPLEGRTNQTAARVVLSSPLSAKTTVFAGLRYQTLSAQNEAGYSEAAAFVGMRHFFK